MSDMLTLSYSWFLSVQESHTDEEVEVFTRPTQHNGYIFEDQQN